MSNETTRLEAFSDGVFAISITLLVLNVIEVPHTAGERLIPTLLHHWPVFAAYLAGFVTILCCWLNHHFVFDHIVRRDHGLFIINGGLLLVISMVPFVTAQLADHALDEDRQAAVALYGITFLLVAVFAFLIWHRASAHKLLRQPTDTTQEHAIWLMYLIGIAYTAVALPVAYFNFYAGLLLYLLLFAGFFVPRPFSNWLKKYAHPTNAAWAPASVQRSKSHRTKEPYHHILNNMSDVFK